MSEGNNEGGGITREEFEAVVGDLQDQIDDLKDDKQQLESKVTELESRLADTESTVESQTADVATDGGVSAPPIEWRGGCKNIENLWIDNIPVGNAIQKARDRVDEVKNDVESLNNGDAAVESDPEDRVDDDWTPVERIAALGEDLADSASDKRAVTIFQNLASWGKKTPKGLVIRTGKDKLKTHLNAARPDDDVSSWKQVYRACEALEDLSDGYISFREVKGSKALVVEAPTPSTTASSEGK
jgi:archaellum component FlaC